MALRFTDGRYRKSANGKAAVGAQRRRSHRRSVKPWPRWVITLASITVMLSSVGDLRPPHQSGVRLLSLAIAVAFWELAVSGQLWSALYDSLAAVFAWLCAGDPVWRAARPADRRFPRGGSSPGNLRHRRLRNAAGCAGAAADPVAWPGFCGQGRGRIPDGAIPDHDQHLARRRRRAQDADRGRKILCGAATW